MSMKIGETEKCWNWKQVDGQWKWVYEDFTYTGEPESGLPVPILKIEGNVVTMEEFTIDKVDGMKVGQYVIQ